MNSEKYHSSWLGGGISRKKKSNKIVSHNYIDCQLFLSLLLSLFVERQWRTQENKIKEMFPCSKTKLNCWSRPASQSQQTGR